VPRIATAPARRGIDDDKARIDLLDWFEYRSTSLRCRGAPGGLTNQ